MTNRCHRQGVTLIEFLVVISIMVLLTNLALPAIQNARELARRTQCQNRLKQLGLAIQIYESTYHELPMQGGGTADPRGWRVVPNEFSNHHRRNVWVASLPFLEKQPLWEQISQPIRSTPPGMFSPLVFPSMGPVPWLNTQSPHQYPPWNEQISDLRCPSDPAGHSLGGETNYAICMGDGIRELGCAYLRPQWAGPHDTHPQRYDDSTKRGMFANWHAFRLADCKDGTSTTILLGEIGIADGSRRVLSHVWSQPGVFALDPQRCNDMRDPQRGTHYRTTGGVFERGGRWADAALAYSGFNTVLPPNSPSCVEQPAQGAHADWFGGIFSVGSFHSQGAHVVMVDGSLRFISSNIQSETPGVSRSSVFHGSVNELGCESPYGIWGAMGTRSSSETIP